MRSWTGIAAAAAGMLILPFPIVWLAPAQAGMLISILLLYCINPVICIAYGWRAGQCRFWLSPLILAAAAWAGAALAFGTVTAFMTHAAAYFLLGICALLLCAGRKGAKNEMSDS